MFAGRAVVLRPNVPAREDGYRSSHPEIGGAAALLQRRPAPRRAAWKSLAKPAGRSLLLTLDAPSRAERRVLWCDAHRTVTHSRWLRLFRSTDSPRAARRGPWVERSALRLALHS